MKDTWFLRIQEFVYFKYQGSHNVASVSSSVRFVVKIQPCFIHCDLEIN
jgi:hypothetical protein